MDSALLDWCAEELHRQEVALLCRKAALSWAAREAGRAKQLAGMWHNHTTGRVKNLARICENFITKYITLETSEGVFKAALQCADEHADSPKPWRRDAVRWWLLARRYGWSSRKLKDAADVAKGRRVSRVKLLNNQEADVAEWDIISGPDGYGGTEHFGRVELWIPGWQPSGEKPQWVQVTVVEVLQPAAEAPERVRVRG